MCDGVCVCVCERQPPRVSSLQEKLLVFCYLDAAGLRPRPASPLWMYVSNKRIFSECIPAQTTRCVVVCLLSTINKTTIAGVLSSM